MSKKCFYVLKWFVFYNVYIMYKILVVWNFKMLGSEINYDISLLW